MEEEGGGLMELLRSGELLSLEREEEEYYIYSNPATSLSSPVSCDSSVSQGMLCFAVDGDRRAVNGGDSTKSTVTTATTTRLRDSKRAETGGGRGGRRTTAAAAANRGTTTAVTFAGKKPKTEAAARVGTPRVRKEKLGERITALQQLVSPFGKTDTASVLHEALGYINFLHDQVQVLSSPYLQCLPSSSRLHDGGGDAGWNDLKSRGLCLVPVSCTEHVANGADFWAPPIGGGGSSNSSSSNSNTAIKH